MVEYKTEKDERDMKKRTATTTETERMEPAAGERTIRQGAAVDTPSGVTPATERPVTGTVVPPGIGTTRAMPPHGTMTDTTVRHARDETVHQDWETQPQINAPRDVGIPTAEGQADAARLRAGQRRNDVAEEPRIDRRGGDVEVPAASGARTGSMTEKAREVKEETKAKAHDVKEDVDRKI